MLDDETTRTTPTTTDETPAPTPRRRRATSAAAGAAGTPETTPAPTGATEPATDEPATDDAAPAPVARKTPAKNAAPRKRAAGPAAGSSDGPDASEGADGAPTAPTAESTATAGSAETDVPTPVAEDVDPAGRTRRRRVPAVVTFQAPDAVAAEATADVTDGAADDDAAPRRRRRAGTAGAIAPAAFIAPPEEPAPAPGEVADLDDDEDEDDPDRRPRRRRGGRGRGRRPAGEGMEPGEDGAEGETEPAGGPGEDDEDDGPEFNANGTRRRRRRRRRTGSSTGDGPDLDDPPGTVVHVREPRPARVRGASAADEDGVRGIQGSTRMAAKRARRQEGRDSGRRRPPILTEAEFLSRREAVERVMVVRQQGDRTQIAVLEDGILVEHYVTKASAQSYAGNVYLGKVQNVLPSMEAAFVDIGKSRNAVLYAGEVNYDAQLAGHGPRKIESVLKGGQEILVQVTKDPIGHKGARLTSQVSLPGRYLVYVPEGSMTGISRKLPENERTRLKSILKTVVPEDAGVIIRTAAEGVGEEEIARDVRRLQAQWEVIKTKAAKGGGPVLLHAEPDLVIRVVRDIFNEDFQSLIVSGDSEWETIREYVEFVAPDLAPRLSRHTSDKDVFAEHRIDEQLAKALDRKVFLPSGGSLVIDRTEAMVVVDVNTGKYVGKGGNLEETVTRNNLEAAEEIARQLRLRDMGGIIVVDFIDMVLESNRDLVVRRLVECLGRDRTKHQVAEVTSLGLVQMTRKRVGQGLLESFSVECDHCDGRGVIVSGEPVDHRPASGDRDRPERRPARSGSGRASAGSTPAASPDSAAQTSTAASADTTGPDGAAQGGPKRRRRGGAGAGPAVPLAAAVPPESELAEILAAAPPAVRAVASPRPAEPSRVASEPAPAASGAAGAEPAAPEADSGTPRRRRRATSRPAGPPGAGD